MSYNATIRKGTLCYRQDTGQAVIFAGDIRVIARIISDDISVTEFAHNGVWYTVDTVFVLFDY